DFFAGLELRLADGSVDMPAARARLVQLEEAKAGDERLSIGYADVDNTDEPMSAEDKAELATLRAYINEADQAELRAERDRINAQRRRAIEVEREYLTILQRCVPRAGEKPSAMYYRYWGDNGFEFPIHDALSTFAVDVDTASYTLARRYLQDGYLPERAQIRTEEFVNYATPDLVAPTNGDVFGVSMELAPSPFGPNAEGGGEHMMLRVGVRGMEVDKSEREPVALTFVVDVSGSMKTDNRLELVKHSLRLLVGELRPSDTIALVTFNNSAKRVLDMTSVGNGAAIERALFDMVADGGTNAEAGLTLGFAEAVVAHTPGAQNRVVFLSDGVGNIGETNENQLLEDARRAREKGIYLNTIGFGMTNHNDRFLEQLANGGDGLCNYVDSPDEAQRALVDNFTGAFQTIARDVKIQVEFNKSQVLSYRQLGYENRAIADSDFRNDKVDAGEIGAGHQVVALYEIVLRDSWTETRLAPLATTRVRYKAPYGQLEEGAEDKATEITSYFHFGETSDQFDGASIGFQKSAFAAQFAEFLRRSSHAKGDSVSLLRYRLEELAKTTNDPELIELSALVQLAQPQLEPALLVENQVRQRADDLQRFEYECETHAYIYDDTTEEWLAKTTATRLHLRQELRREVYGAYGLED
ncbi:MAG: von Willebrand factor type A domain-containing protein, partial [Planctomycetota bacterium]|nr:von Willebrand factor type A domain-containing protein [Planctomycetota bacterium]